MNKNGDKELIQKFIDWCISQGFTQSKIGLIVDRTKGWASMLINGKINHLQFNTRNRIKKVLGI
jgi:hypothetical protein